MALLVLCGCSRLDTIAYSPVLSPADFLKAQPYTEIHIGSLNFILTQPSSSILVLLAGLYALWVGVRLLLRAQGQVSRMWWGIGLCLTGLGVLAAGVSYQAFGYQIKCDGRGQCTWTSWWEVAYMLLSAPAMCCYLIACATCTANPKLRRSVLYYAGINTVVFVSLVLFGALVPVRFLVSFDFMGLVSTPGLLVLILLHGLSYRSEGDMLNYYFFRAWVMFLGIILAYFWFMWLGIHALLWQHGIWLTDNDILHIGMLLWVYYIHTRLFGSIKDGPAPAARLTVN
jgi:hypothetical protein